jgi:hypothetical protein
LLGRGWSISRVLCGYDAFAIPASSQQLTNIKEAQPFIHVFNWDFDIILNGAKDKHVTGGSVFGRPALC